MVLQRLVLAASLLLTSFAHSVHYGSKESTLLRGLPAFETTDQNNSTSNLRSSVSRDLEGENMSIYDQLEPELNGVEFPLELESSLLKFANNSQCTVSYKQSPWAVGCKVGTTVGPKLMSVDLIMEMVVTVYDPLDTTSPYMQVEVSMTMLQPDNKLADALTEWPYVTPPAQWVMEKGTRRLSEVSHQYCLPVETICGKFCVTPVLKIDGGSVAANLFAEMTLFDPSTVDTESTICNIASTFKLGPIEPEPINIAHTIVDAFFDRDDNPARRRLDHAASTNTLPADFDVSADLHHRHLLLDWVDGLRKLLTTDGFYFGDAKSDKNPVVFPPRDGELALPVNNITLPVPGTTGGISIEKGACEVRHSAQPWMVRCSSTVILDHGLANLNGGNPLKIHMSAGTKVDPRPGGVEDFMAMRFSLHVPTFTVALPGGGDIPIPEVKYEENEILIKEEDVDDLLKLDLCMSNVGEYLPEESHQAQWESLGVQQILSKFGMDACLKMTNSSGIQRRSEEAQLKFIFSARMFDPSVMPGNFLEQETGGGLLQSVLDVLGLNEPLTYELDIGKELYEAAEKNLEFGQRRLNPFASLVSSSGAFLLGTKQVDEEAEMIGDGTGAQEAASVAPANTETVPETPGTVSPVMLAPPATMTTPVTQDPALAATQTPATTTPIAPATQTPASMTTPATQNPALAATETPTTIAPVAPVTLTSATTSDAVEPATAAMTTVPPAPPSPAPQATSPPDSESIVTLQISWFLYLQVLFGLLLLMGCWFGCKFGAEQMSRTPKDGYENPYEEEKYPPLEPVRPEASTV